MITERRGKMSFFDMIILILLTAIASYTMIVHIQLIRFRIEILGLLDRIRRNEEIAYCSDRRLLKMILDLKADKKG